MSTFSTSSARLSPKQAITIAGLVGVLLYVLVFSSVPNDGQTAAGLASTETLLLKRDRLAVEAKTAAKRWPAISLADMLQQNPFKPIESPIAEPPLATADDNIEIEVAEVFEDNMTPDDIADDESPDQSIADLKSKHAEIDRKGDSLTALQGHKVKMMLRTGNKVSALIGDRLVHEGDIIDGHRIISILPKGIRVEPVADK